MIERPFNIPIAIQKNTNKIVDIKDVPNGLECNCFCPDCKEDLIAVNREIKQKAHFRHSPDSKCSSNGETYIHWLTKEVFKNIKQMLLPPITSNDLKRDKQVYNKFRSELKNYFINKGLLPEFDKLIFTDFQLQSTSEIKINSCKAEETYESNLGKIRVDVVHKVKNDELFIEPYFTNKIKEDKYFKLVDLNVSTISINLISFITANGWCFTIESFKNFLINNIDSKKWEFIRTTKIEKLTHDFINKLDKEIKEHEPLIQKNNELKQKIKGCTAKKKMLISESLKLEDEISYLEKKIVPFPFEKLFHRSPFTHL